MNLHGKIICRYAIFAAAFAAALSACSKSSGAGNTADNALVIGIKTSSFVTNYQDNYLTRYLEEKCGVKLKFYQLPSDGSDLNTKLSLLVSSNDLPDIIMADGINPNQVLDYGSKGAFIPLNKYLADPELTPNFAAIPDEDKAVIMPRITGADGNIYTLFRYDPYPWNDAPYRYYINKVWLDKLGLSVPKTTAELRNVLAAFRDRDPNGNGKKDELGLYGNFRGGYGENSIAALINSFVFYVPGSLALDEAGKAVAAPFTAPAFRKALQYLSGLYRDGVLPASVFTDDLQQFQAVLNTRPAIVGLVTAGSNNNWPNADTNANFIELELIPPFTGPDGVCYTPYANKSVSLAFSITSKCKNPELAIQFLDAFFAEDVSNIVRFGEEGVDWSRNAEDLAKTSNAYVEMGLFPALSMVSITDTWAAPNNKHWHNINPRYVSEQSACTAGDLFAPYDSSLPTARLRALHYQWYMDKHPRHILPPLQYRLEEASQIAEPSSAVNDYVQISIAEFITGARDINNNAAWASYLKDLDNMGLQQWLAAAQAAYDRGR